MKLIEALLKFEENVKKGKKFFDNESGICWNLSELGKTFYNFEIKQLALSWKHFSGDLTYPIGGEKVYQLHKENGTLWKDEQLKFRLDFIKHMIKELKKKDA